LLNQIINLLDDKNKSKGIGTRKETRKKERDEKIIDRTADTSATCGITMDQRIEIQNLNVRQEVMLDRQRETSIVAFLIEESMIANQLEQAERRAELRCPQYDTTNIFWKKVNKLSEKQEAVLQQIEELNVAKKPSENDIPHPLDTFVTGNSPDKKISDVDSFVSSSSPTIIDPIPIYSLTTQEAAATTSNNNNVAQRNLESSDSEESSMKVKSKRKVGSKVPTKKSKKTKRLSKYHVNKS